MCELKLGLTGAGFIGGSHAHKKPVGLAAPGEVRPGNA